MRLVIQSLNLPPLYTTQGHDDPMVRAKWFTPFSPNFRWYVLEYDPDEKLAFAFVTSDMLPQGELGYVSVTELEGLQGPWGLGVERDIFFEPKTLAQVKQAVAECGVAY